MRQARSAIRAYHDPALQPQRETQCERIEGFLRDSGRARTLKEIAVALGIPDSTVSARLNKMKERGVLALYLERTCEVNGLWKQTWFLAPTPKPKTTTQRNLFGGRS